MVFVVVATNPFATKSDILVLLKRPTKDFSMFNPQKIFETNSLDFYLVNHKYLKVVVTCRENKPDYGALSLEIKQILNPTDCVLVYELPNEEPIATSEIIHGAYCRELFDKNTAKFIVSESIREEVQKQLLRNGSLSMEIKTHLHQDFRLEAFERFRCEECSNVPTKPLVTDCCRRVRCIHCTSQCKKCSSVPNLVRERFVSGVLGKVKSSCVCGKLLSRKELYLHKKECPARVFTCYCGFEDDFLRYAKHIITQHPDEVIKNSHNILNGARDFTVFCPFCGKPVQKAVCHYCKQYILPSING